MKHMIVALLVCLSSLVLPGEPVALLGHSWDIRKIENEVLKPRGITAIAPKDWPDLADCGKYPAIYVGESLPKDKDCTWQGKSGELLDYVRNGGTLIFSGGAIYNLAGAGRDLSELSELLGFAAVSKVTPDECRHFDFENQSVPAAAGITPAPKDWHLCASVTADKRTTAEVLAWYGGSPRQPALTVNRLGKGAVYWVGPLLFRFSQLHKNVGDADENGVFILNEAGKSLRDLMLLYGWLFAQANGLEIRAAASATLELKPLGDPGTMTGKHAFKHKPAFRPPRPVETAFALSKNSTAVAEIVASAQFHALAAELKYHLDTITGGDFKISETRTPGQNAIVFEADDGLPENTAVAVTQDTAIVLGGNGVGPALATYYLLEKLGCRYLWPGKLGKIIPREPSLAAPRITLNQAPGLAFRRIRYSSLSGPRDVSGLKNCGIDHADAYQKLYKQAMLDLPGNASFYLWHGNGGGDEYRWGHSFTDYYQRFGKSHPEFFALQPDGTRSQETSPDRPRLCHSNPALAEQAAQDRIALLRSDPQIKAVSIALTDGGPTTYCLCPECRKLDPVNAWPCMITTLVMGNRQQVRYVALTDRVLEFSNRIAEKTVAALPDRALTVYAYSVYEQPPVKVKPHPALIVLCTAMDYTDDARRTQALSTLAAWSNLAARWCWRPNALWGFHNAVAPQNYARKIFEDAELLSANGALGMDFDCNEQFWACKGLVYYALAKALWNPDRLSFDDIAADYFQSGFGTAASEILAYHRRLEEITDRAAASALPYLSVFDDTQIAALHASLDRAAGMVNEPAIKERIEFLRIGLKAGEYQRHLHVAEKNKDIDRFQTLQNEFTHFVRTTSFEQPAALNPGRIGFSNPYVTHRR